MNVSHPSLAAVRLSCSNARGLTHWMAGVLLALVMALLSTQAHAQAAGSPEALIQKVTAEALAAIKADASVQAGNPRRLMQLVDEKILPYVDFEKTTRLAAGRYWRQATAAQQQSLVREFRTTLVRTYSGAVSAVKQQTTVELRPSHRADDAADVVVRTQIKQAAGDAIPVDYRMEKAGSGWKIYDVNVMGVWLIENYRNQFAQQISQSGIDGLIKSLEERNQQFK